MLARAGGGRWRRLRVSDPGRARRRAAFDGRRAGAGVPTRGALPPGLRDVLPDGNDVRERMSAHVREHRRVAVFGGVYSNAPALAAAIADARARSVDAMYCLGDLGGFGPWPDRIVPVLRDAGVHVSRGNYDESIAAGLDDCGCGYTDPRDNHYAQISYQYTRAKTSPRHLGWLRALPARLRVQTDVLLCTHTGLPWQRRLPSGRRVVNVGAIGRPANDGGTHVWYALFDAERDDQP